MVHIGSYHSLPLQARGTSASQSKRWEQPHTSYFRRPSSQSVSELEAAGWWRRRSPRWSPAGYHPGALVWGLLGSPMLGKGEEQWQSLNIPEKSWEPRQFYAKQQQPHQKVGGEGQTSPHMEALVLQLTPLDWEPASAHPILPLGYRWRWVGKQNITWPTVEFPFTLTILS